jgi:hypothetical protein
MIIDRRLYMKKSYALLITILVVVVLAFTFGKGYLSRLDTSDRLLKQKLSREELSDSLSKTYEQMLGDNSTDLQARFDSLRNESDALIYSLESQLDLYISQEYDPLLQQNSSGDTDVTASDDARADLTGMIVTPSEYEIYIAYLERIKDFPKDLSSYEKRVEVGEVKRKLMKQFSLSRKDLDRVLLKLRQRSKDTEKSS